MANKPLDFQRATADHVLEAYKNGQKRVLVADEAGLGKTTVASQVVRRVKTELQKEVLDDDGLYCIVYVCCNLQIAQQNIDTLSDDGDKVDLSQSRLSMQHYVYYKKKAELQAAKKDTLVLSLTPATSFQMTWGTGSANERALMYACLTLQPRFEEESYRIKLSELLAGNAKISWPKLSQDYYEEVRKDNMSEYRDTIIQAMDSHLSQNYSTGESIQDALVRLCDSNDKKSSEAYNLIIKLRKMFADISLEIMKPDLVIMDEFQKFSSLISTDEEETEENMIARKFFANKDTYILLLSATPYKPYTTLEELNETNNDEQYKDFHRLMNFLHANDNSEEDFKVVWRDYSTALKHLDKEVDTVITKHNVAEDMLYHVMGRTERANEGIFHEDLSQIGDYLTDGDIASYIQMQHLIDNCRKFGKKVYSAPVDYTKSSAFQLSFMDNYKLKDSISDAWKNGAGRGIEKDCLLLDKNAIDDYSLRDYRNAKLNYVIDNIFGKGKNVTGVETLLWIPASHPYYTQQSNVFTRNASFSKYLAFSSWGMVPKMMASLISYEAERRLYRRTRNPEYQPKEKFSGPLRDDEKGRGETILKTVSIYLAELYNPEEWYGQNLSEIKNHLKTQIKARLNAISRERINRVSSLDIYQLLKVLDDDKEAIRNIPADAEDVLAEIAIGTPANCLYRIFKRLGDVESKEHAEDVADAMTTIFNNRYGVAAVRNNCRMHSNYFQNVIDYCIQGNLQSVLDEFVHMIGEAKAFDTIVERIKDSFISATSIDVNTIQTFGTDKRFSMRRHFAVDFGSGQQSEKDVNRSINVRSAFNSPFRPFVLASTSVGQEGLDFHWYCRKMIHWNLPSNPQNLEQREGRINRYKCLAVRRNIAKLYEKDHIFSWNKMFEQASADLKQDNPEMVPFWYLPLKDEHFKGVTPELIERIVPMYPMSEDESRYDRLIKVLSLYRLTMGQPRQEELLQLLEGKATSDQMQKLLFDLSPFSRRKKNK